MKHRTGKSDTVRKGEEGSNHYDNYVMFPVSGPQLHSDCETFMILCNLTGYRGRSIRVVCSCGVSGRMKVR